MNAIVAHVLALDVAERVALVRSMQPTLRNLNGIVVGALPAIDAFA